MTLASLNITSPWTDYMDKLRAKYPGRIDNHLYYDDDIDVIHPADLDTVKAYNASRKDKDFQFITNLLAAPFQGNPLTAKVVFLSLNPGYVERLNKDLAKVFEQIPNLPNKINDIWSGFLSHKATSISPSTQHNQLFTAYQSLVDWYWHDTFATLRESCNLSKDEFFKRVAVMQLMPYHSTKCNKVLLNLPTQQYTKNLILQMLNQPDCPLFVVMRSEVQWAKLLFGLKDGFKNSPSKDHFILRKRNANDSRPRGQYINENAFDDNIYNTIVNAINS